MELNVVHTDQELYEWEGYQAFNDALPRIDNPHFRGTPEEHWWNIGWDTAYKEFTLDL